MHLLIMHLAQLYRLLIFQTDFQQIKKKTIAKRYNILQGGSVVGTFDIPADKFVSSGQLYTATSADTSLVEGNVYLRVTVNDLAGTQVDIPVQGLVDITTYKYTSNNETLELGGLIEDNE